MCKFFKLKCLPSSLSEKKEPIEFDASRLTFANFNLTNILEKGARLMGSEGTEFDYQDDFDQNSREHLQHQRALLNEKLGLHKASTIGINITDLVSLDDMRMSSNCYEPNIRLMPVQDILNQQQKPPSGPSTDLLSSQALSCREMNRARRKARQNPIGCATTTAGTTIATNLSRSNSLTNGCTPEGLFEPPEKRNKSECKTESSLLMTNGKFNIIVTFSIIIIF